MVGQNPPKQLGISLTQILGRHQEEVTVHLLGGANMSSDGTGQSGVTNHAGEVFTSLGSEVHQGLVCCDASIIPTSLGEFSYIPTTRH